MADTPQTIETVQAAARYVGANPFLRDPTIVPGEGIHAQTQGADLTPQTPHELTLEVQRNIAVLSELASSTTDPEVKAELNAAISQLASVMGAPNARAVMGEIMRGAQGAISYAQGGSTGGYAGGAGSGTKAAVAAGRMPTSYEIYSSPYVSSSGYIREGYVDQFLQGFGYSQETRTAVMRANDVMRGSPLANDASFIATTGAFAENDPSFRRIYGEQETQQGVVAVSTQVRAFYNTAGEIRDPAAMEVLGRLREEAERNNDYATLDLLDRLEAIAVDTSIPDDARLPLGHYADEQREAGGDFAAVAPAHGRDVRGMESFLSTRFGGQMEEFREIARSLDIDTTGMSDGQILFAITVKARGSDDPRLQPLLEAREVSEMADVVASAVTRMTPEQMAEFAQADDARQAEILHGLGYAITSEQFALAEATILPMITDEAALLRLRDAREADIRSIEAGEVPMAYTTLLLDETTRYITSGAYSSFQEASAAAPGAFSNLVTSFTRDIVDSGVVQSVGYIASSLVSGDLAAQDSEGLERIREATLERMLALEPPETPDVLKSYSDYYGSRAIGAREAADEAAALRYEQRRDSIQARLGLISPIAQPDPVLSPDLGGEVSAEELEIISAQDDQRMRLQAEERLAERDPLIDRFHADPARYMNAEPGSPDAELYADMEDALFYRAYDEVMASGEFPGALAFSEAERRLAASLEAAGSAGEASGPPTQETDEERRIREAYAQYATSRTEGATIVAAEEARQPASDIPVSPDTPSPAPATDGIPPAAAAAAAAAAAPAASAGCNSAGAETADALTAPPPPSPSAVPPPLASSGVGPC